MLSPLMNDVGYRSSNVPLRERLSVLRAEVERLRTISPLRRAILPPATVHELDALGSRIDATIEQSLSMEMVTTLSALSQQLATVVARSNAEVERMRARPREVSPPPAPRRFAFGSHKLTFSIEKPFREQLRRATEVGPYGVGMLATLQHEGSPLAFVARGQRSDHLFPMRKLFAVLRTAVPRGPSLTIEPRSFFRQVFPSRDAIALDPAFDKSFVTKGNAAVVKELLHDARIRHTLFMMHGELIVLAVDDGVVDLVWRRPFNPASTAVLPETALKIVTTIADRLYAA